MGRTVGSINRYPNMPPAWAALWRALSPVRAAYRKRASSARDWEQRKQRQATRGGPTPS